MESYKTDIKTLLTATSIYLQRLASKIESIHTIPNLDKIDIFNKLNHMN